MLSLLLLNFDRFFGTVPLPLIPIPYPGLSERLRQLALLIEAYASKSSDVFR